MRILLYRPLSKLTRSRSDDLDLPPTLLVAAEKDTLCPAMYGKHVAKRIENMKLLLLDGAGHFDVYGKEFDRVIEQEAAFLKKHLVAP
jgi:pimeloyl-ACP methyl ester carboxylesterase